MSEEIYIYKYNAIVVAAVSLNMKTLGWGRFRHVALRPSIHRCMAVKRQHRSEYRIERKKLVKEGRKTHKNSLLALISAGGISGFFSIHSLVFIRLLWYGTAFLHFVFQIVLIFFFSGICYDSVFFSVLVLVLAGWSTMRWAISENNSRFPLLHIPYVLKDKNSAKCDHLHGFYFSCFCFFFWSDKIGWEWGGVDFLVYRQYKLRV